MDSAFLVIVLVAVAAGVAAWIYLQRNKSKQLRSRFGPEYEAEVVRQGDRFRAEKELSRRAKRVDKLEIRPLSSHDTEHYLAAWKQTQARFVDNPKDSIREADNLVAEVMKLRGYPMEDFEVRAADLSVDHPHVVKHYRAAHEIALRHDRGEASTEDLRQALIHYRELFEDLLHTHETRQEVHQWTQR